MPGQVYYSGPRRYIRLGAFTDRWLFARADTPSDVKTLHGRPDQLVPLFVMVEPYHD